MTRPDDIDEFLRELASSEGEGSLDLLGELFSARASRGGPEIARARLLAAAKPEGRRARFAHAVAELLDLSVERASLLLDTLDDSRVWTPTSATAAFYWVEGGPRLRGASRGFLRIASGARTAEHEHEGEEITLVLEGRYVDLVTGLRYGPGDVQRNPGGSSHTLEVIENGPDLLQLAIVYGGVRIGGRTFGPVD
jgi:hypothetical protein